MIPPAEIKALEALLDAIETPGVRLVCGHCGAELPGSDFTGKLVSLGRCLPFCSPNDGWPNDTNSLEDSP
jgi:hypothetical protein